MTTSELGDVFKGRSVRRATPIREQVAEMIRDAITGQQFDPGQVLVERELCEATGASRASVREALRQLEAEGLVSSEPGRGTTVVQLDAREAQHIYETRAALEGLAGRLFVQRATDEEVEALKAIVFEIAGLAGDVEAVLSKKSEFYDLLFKGTRNPELTRMIGTIHRRITLLRGLSLTVPARMDNSLAEMKEIVSKIEERDAAGAADLLVAHVEAAAKAATERLHQTA